jgi:hypothetical protein
LLFYLPKSKPLLNAQFTCDNARIFAALNPDLNGFEGWMDKKLIFNGLKVVYFKTT